jgi:hypothetical protein
MLKTTLSKLQKAKVKISEPLPFKNWKIGIIFFNMQI